MPSKSAKHRKALREIAISNLKKDRNFFVVGLTYGWRRSWNRIFLHPARSRMIWSRRSTEPGVSGRSGFFGEGNSQRELAVF